MNDPLAYDPEDAYYGPLGEFAKRHRNQITLNLAAFYAMLLPAIGSLIGRRAVITVSRDRHYPNLFSAIVGSTGSGKGNCWNIVEHLLEKIDPTSPARLRRDAASAQGLIGLVRDASTRTEGKRTIEDPGVTDKRCLLLFEEMDTLFVAMSRTGSTLAPVWNMAYDGKTLENNTRLNRERATNPHISAVCHITQESFQQAVQHVSKGLGCSNGFYNRFITAHAVEERRLSRGGEMPNVDDLVERIRDALAALGPDSANEALTITWHPSTHKAWDEFDDALASAHPFLSGLGGLAARLRPNTMRVAMIFAIMDGDREIMPCHLKAAKSFCLQCIDDSRGFFDRSSTSSAKPSLDDRLLTIAATGPCSLTDFHKRLGKKGYATKELRDSLARLVKGGELLKEDSESDHGRTVTRWRLPDTLCEDPERTESECAAELVELDDEGQDLCDGCDEALREFVEIDGMRLAYGDPAAFKCETTAQALDGRQVQIKKGLECCLAKVAVDATRAQRDRTHSWLREHAGHVCVIVGEIPVLTKLASLQVPFDDFAIA
jgi:hypothetical protein